MVLGNQVDYGRRKIRLPRDGDPGCDVVLQDMGTLPGAELVVRTDSTLLVFHKEIGPGHLADIVVKTGNSLQRAGLQPDCLGRPLAEGANGDAVIVGSGGLQDQLPDEGKIQVPQF